jgi:hypothetical protein
MDVDFAVHVAHARSQLRADLKQLITGLGFTDYLAAEGVLKFTGGGYEVEFIGQRSGGRNPGFLSVPEWNVTAIPLPFINILMDFSDFRQKGDYADYVEFEEVKIKEWLAQAESFIDEVEQVIEKDVT